MNAPLGHPFVRLPARARRPALFVFAAATLAIALQLSSLDRGLRTPAAPRGMISFELAATAERATQILAAWGSEGRELATRSLWLDFGFLAAYAPWLALLCAGASERMRARRAPLAATGAALAWGQLAAGGLDAIENFALLRVLAADSPGAWPALATACAWPKFALVALGAFFWIATTLIPKGSERDAR